MKASLILASLSVAGFSQAATGMNDQVCGYIKEDNKSQLNKTLKSNRLSVDSLYKFTKCEGMDIFAYAEKSQADDTLQYLNKKASKRLKKSL